MYSLNYKLSRSNAPMPREEFSCGMDTGARFSRKVRRSASRISMETSVRLARAIPVLSVLLIAQLMIVRAAHAADAPKVVVKPVVTTSTTASGQPITVPANPQVIVSTYEIPPGVTLPVHKHPFQRYAYVLAGNLSVVNKDTDQTYRYKTGDFIVEVLDQWHLGRNEGKTPVKLLVIDQVEPGTSNTVLAPR